MWTGGKPPRIPQQALRKPSSDGNKGAVGTTTGTNPSGVAFRPTGVNAELEALKQRGLAKILNKHFTETAEQLAQEKAAVDAAIADLERRKANTSEFQSSTNNELSPLDAMYVKANAWRNETRRKERETLLLYQRYVDKFGSTGQVRLPVTNSPSSRGTLVGACGAPSPTNDKNPQSGSPPAVQVRDGKSWIVHDDGSVTSADKPAAPSSAPSSSLVPTMAAEIERCLDEYIQKGGLGLPSVEVLGGVEKTFHSTRTKEEHEFRNYYRRQLEKRGIDAKSPTKERAMRDAFFGPGWVESLGRGIMPRDLIGNNNNNTDEKYSVPWNNFEKGTRNGDEGDDDDDDEDIDLMDEDNDDDCSAVSGLTSIHSHITRSVIQDCERSVYEFLKEERTNIQQMLQQEENVYTAQLEHESGTKNANATKATEDAENMVKQMENILHEYQTKQNADDASQTKNETGHEPRRFYTDNPDELWMIYYDEFYQQEYFHECNSNRTQWDPPANVVNDHIQPKDASSTSVSGTGSENDIGSVSSGHANLILGYDDVMPENGHRRHRSSGSTKTGSRAIAYESRIAEYRRKRRRERKRKILAMLFIFVMTVVGLVSYCTVYQPEVMENVTMKLEEYYNTMFSETSSRSVVMETEVSRAGANNPFVFDFQRDVIVKTLDSSDGACQADDKAIDIAKKAKEERAAMLQAKALERRRRRQEEIERREYLRRPWACNIPFAYLVHGRCKRLAKQNPWFNLQELVMSMLH